jgi:hypothetical protein
MRRGLFTFGLIGIVLAVLVALNLVFMSQPREVENEANGDRSSYRATPFGTLAFYTLLAEQGRSIERFEQPFTSLQTADVATLFVVVPSDEAQPTQQEIEAVESWVANGGNLVIIDRAIHLKSRLGEIETRGPLIGRVTAVAPSPYTRGVDELKLTDYATSVEDVARESVVHFAGANGALLIDKPFGEGHITFLSEPFIVQNNGIREKSNLALALNLVDGLVHGGTIAFDEYHHGHGRADSAGRGGLRGYIAGTPVPWILAQLALLAVVIAITAGTRFGRPIPLPRGRRTSALEFVSSMANIQRLARASDLAIENVYSNFRARLCRYANLPSDSPSDTLATAVALRGRFDAERLLSVMRRCENALAGAPPTPDELVQIVTELRAIEAELKM